MGNVLGGGEAPPEPHVQHVEPEVPRSSGAKERKPSEPRQKAPQATPDAEGLAVAAASSAAKEARRLMKAFELEHEHVDSLLKRWIENRKAKRSRGKAAKGAGAKKLRETGLPIPKDGDKAQKKRQFVKAFVDNALPRLDSLDLAGKDELRGQRRTIVRDLEDLDRRAAAWLSAKLAEDPMKSSKGSDSGKKKGAGAKGGGRKARTKVPTSASGAVPGFEAPEREGEVTSTKLAKSEAVQKNIEEPTPAPRASSKPAAARLTSGPVTAASLAAAAAVEADQVLTQLAEESQDISLKVGFDEGWVSKSLAAQAQVTTARPAAGGASKAKAASKRSGAAGRPAAAAKSKGVFVYPQGPMKGSR